MCTITSYLISKFTRWCPASPTVVSTSAYDIELAWAQCEQPFGYLNELLLYRVCVNDKLNGWIQVYCGGKCSNVICNLSPAHAYQFRLQVVLRDVTRVAAASLAYHKCERDMLESFGDHNAAHDTQRAPVRRFAESSWSAATDANTMPIGTSVACLCFAIKGGYVAQVQSMLEERPAVVNIRNAATGQTPLIAAIRRGELPLVQLLVRHGADIELSAACSRTPLHNALLCDKHHIAAFLMQAGATLHARDANGLRAEHMCVRSVECVTAVREHGGDFTQTDNNGWTPLHYAVLVGVGVDVLELLVKCGCDVHVKDKRGLDLIDVAGMARSNDASLRRVLNRRHLPSTAAMHQFTRITNIITRLNTITKTT